MSNNDGTVVTVGCLAFLLYLGIVLGFIALVAFVVSHIIAGAF